MIKSKVKISKLLSFILRHHPQRYDIVLDKYGFGHFTKVFEVVQRRFPFLEKNDLVQIIEDDPKMRFELDGVKIRARYGHSIDVEPSNKPTADLPDHLYHGTAQKSVESILKDGLLPGRRKFVHLSLNLADAIRVGKRKDSTPAVLEVDVKGAQNGGINFWMEGTICLSNPIPPKYIKIHLEKYQ